MPSVFISYSHDSPEHSKRVLDFANALRKHGVEAELDQFHKYDLHHWPIWCAEQIKSDKHDYVLCICTNEYLRRLEGKVAPGVGMGVWWEGQHLIGEIYHDKDNRRFIAVQFDTEILDAIYTLLRNYSRFTVSQFDHERDEAYKSLLRLLYGKTEIRQEPVGKPPEFLDDDFDIGESVSENMLLQAKKAETDFHEIFRPEIRFGRVHRYVPTHLIGRDRYLKDLDKALNRKSTRIFSIVAFGGVGKTSLVAKWLDRLGGQGWKGFDKVFAWSFYSQGTRKSGGATADEFLREALIHFGDRELAESNASSWKKGERLAQLADEGRSLIVLDGLEPLQYPPGPLDGMLQDLGIEALLTNLSRSPQFGDKGAFCVLTTRESVGNLKPFEDGVVDELKLETLAPEAGAELLHLAGATRAGEVKIQPDDRLLIETSEKLDGHALTLQLLGSYLKGAWHGDIRQIDKVDLAKASTATQGGHAFHVMAAYEAWLAEGDDRAVRQLAVLRLLGLFDRPATQDCLEALRRAPVIEGLTEPLQNLSEADWNLALTDLQSAGLIKIETPESDQSHQVTIDAHPLLREYFSTQLRNTEPNAFRAAHRRLYVYLSEIADPLPNDLPGLQPLYQAVQHGCRAGEYQKSCNLFQKRIQRSKEYFSTYKLGLISSDLTALASFFQRPWSKLHTDVYPEQAPFLFGQVGYSLKSMARFREAIEAFTESIKLSIELERPEWSTAANSTGLMSQLYLHSGSIPNAIAQGNQAVDFAEKAMVSANLNARESCCVREIINLTFLGDALHQRGDFERSLQIFERAEQRQKETIGEGCLYLGNGYRYCELLLSMGQDGEVLKRLPTMKKLDVKHDQNSYFSSALRELLLVRLGILQKSNGDRLLGRISKAEHLFRKASRLDFLPLVLSTRAIVLMEHLSESNCEESIRVLCEAEQIAERGPMPLYLADVHLYRARIFRNRDELAKARALIEKHEYWRRREELEDAEEAAKRW